MSLTSKTQRRSATQTKQRERVLDPKAGTRHTLEQRAKGAGASDRTKYGTSRCSARSYVVHHTQRISLAAAMYDAMAIRKRLLGKKQKIAAPAAPTDDARA